MEVVKELSQFEHSACPDCVSILVLMEVVKERLEMLRKLLICPNVSILVLMEVVKERQDYRAREKF